MAFLQPENIPSRNDLPARLQSVARALRDLLPEDVTVWLERTGDGDTAALQRDFDQAGRPRDSSDAGPYLVVLDPEAGIAVIEAPTVTSSRRRILRTRELNTNPLRADIAGRAAALRNGLDAGSIRSLPVVHVLAFADTLRQDLPTGVQVPMLAAEDFEPDQLRDALHRALGGHPRRLSDEEETEVRATVKPEIVIGSTGQLFHPPDDAEQIRALDRRQERLARHLGGGYRLIRGVAGSGKTLILTHRARHFAEHFPDWRILLLCFNRALSFALAREVKGARNVEAQGIDALARRLLRDAGRPVDEKKPDYEERRKAALAVAHDLDDSDRFDMILVDEAQDLGSSGLDLAWAMLKEGRDHFVIAFDSAQKVYRRRMTWNPPGMTARGRATVLPINYRNTREILTPALEILRATAGTESNDPQSDDLDVLVMPEDAIRHGQITPSLACTDLRAEARAIAGRVRKLRETGADPEHIVVLSGSRELRDEVLKEVPDAVDARRSNDRGASAHGKVRVASLQLLKGLEFRHVIVGGANHVWVPKDDEQAQDEQRRRLLYVGMTRATETLTVTFSGEGLMDTIQPAPFRRLGRSRHNR